jgi:hypothetical protein
MVFGSGRLGRKGSCTLSLFNVGNKKPALGGWLDE